MKGVVQIWTVFLIVFFSVHSHARTLPDFTELVEENSAAVVKINTLAHAQANSRTPQSPYGNRQSPQQMPDIFRRLLEPRQPQQERDVRSMGSGFIISEDGYILTNNHVVGDADEIIVRLVDRREFEAKVIGKDERSDLALLKVDAENLPVVTFADSDDLKVGAWVLAIGSPFGLDFSVSAGIVSAIGRSIPTERNENYVPFIQTDVAINPGNSGGPLFNMDGEVVGINSQIYTRSGGSIGLSFAIPVAVAKEVVAQLKEKGRVDRGWLGVVIQNVDRDLAKSFGLSKPMGALVNQVAADGPAEKAGIKAGDVIVRFGRNRIDESGDLPHAVGSVTPGDSVEVTLMRAGKKQVLDVEVGTLSSTEEASLADGADPDIAGGRLGLIVAPLDRRMKEAWRLSGGVLVKRVRPKSAAAEAGLRPGDILVQLGFEEIQNLDDYQAVEASMAANTLLPLRFFRQGRPVFRTVIIKE